MWLRAGFMFTFILNSRLLSDVSWCMLSLGSHLHISLQLVDPPCSVGMDISPLDLINIQRFASRVVDLTQYRRKLSEYLNSKMLHVAPNLTSLIGEQVSISYYNSLCILMFVTVWTDISLYTLICMSCLHPGFVYFDTWHASVYTCIEPCVPAPDGSIIIGIVMIFHQGDTTLQQHCIGAIWCLDFYTQWSVLDAVSCTCNFRLQLLIRFVEIIALDSAE